MDEVDKIIIHSLKQIGCTLTDDDNAIFGLNSFSPDGLVRSVSKCLQEIKPDTVLPRSLPENMAQRFAAATTLAECVCSCGYRGDIGYQTFLYPNVVDIRRLFMFLIEQLPKVQDGLNISDGTDERNDYALLMKEIKQKISRELKSPWVPQYCRGMANRKSGGSSSLTVEFLPQLNLHIPQSDGDSQLKEITYQVPNIFQQTSSGDYDLVSSVLHKTAIDLYSSSQSLDGIRLNTSNRSSAAIHSSLKALEIENLTDAEEVDKVEVIPITPLQSLTKEVESLKLQNDQLVKERQKANAELNHLRQQRSNTEEVMEVLKRDIKIHERTCVILENPTENVGKLEGLIDKTRERRLAVDNQWQLHRGPALKQIDDLQKLRQSTNLYNIQELRNSIQDLEINLRDKTTSHVQLADELKRTTMVGVASRKEYTLRIYEFIGNIRKQRNDIYKILDDTRDLQKQLNSVSAQLQRQFNYTDDLLFQSAKHDVHAKKAYKLLASLHASCNEICDMVSQTGQMTKETRDLEVQIDREHMSNVSASLDKITTDIKQFEIMIKSMQGEINQVENEIHSG